MKRVTSIGKINELGHSVAKLATCSLAAACAGLLLYAVGATSIGKWTGAIGMLGLFLSAWFFYSLVKQQNEIIQGFVGTYRNGDRLMGYVANAPSGKQPVAQTADEGVRQMS